MKIYTIHSILLLLVLCQSLNKLCTAVHYELVWRSRACWNNAPCKSDRM